MQKIKFDDYTARRNIKKGRYLQCFNAQIDILIITISSSFYVFIFSNSCLEGDSQIIIIIIIIGRLKKCDTELNQVSQSKIKSMEQSYTNIKGVM